MAKKTHFSYPGAILKREFLEVYGLSVSAAANAMNIGRMTLNEIVRGRRAITAATALRLAKFFGTTPQFWLNLQTHYDLAIEEKNATTMRSVRSIHHAETIASQ